MGHSLPLFFIFDFSMLLRENKCSFFKNVDAGFEPGPSGVGNNHSANFATTTAQLF